MSEKSTIFQVSLGSTINLSYLTHDILSLARSLILLVNAITLYLNDKNEPKIVGKLMTLSIYLCEWSIYHWYSFFNFVCEYILITLLFINFITTGIGNIVVVSAYYVRNRVFEYRFVHGCVCVFFSM